MGAEGIVKHCPKCGSPLDEDGKCPRCGIITYETKRMKEMKVKVKLTRQVKVVIIIALVLAASAMTYEIYNLYVHGSHEYALNFAGLDRRYLLHIPLGYDGHQPVPLVIVLHGATETPISIELATKMSDKSDAEGFIVVYPEGYGATWNVGFGLGNAFASNVDDVGFIRELIDSLQYEYAIDVYRIYVAGFSNGAMMAYRLAAELSDRIAAVAPVAGSTGGRYNSTSQLVINVGSNSAQPVSIIVFHGTADDLVPYNGGEGYEGRIYLSANESVSLWVRHDGCSEVPRIEEISGDPYDMTEYIFSGGVKGTEVVFYKVIGEGHEWSATATDYIWEFFMSHPKKG